MGKERVTKGGKLRVRQVEFAAEPDELEFNSCVSNNGTQIAQVKGPFQMIYGGLQPISNSLYLLWFSSVWANLRQTNHSVRTHVATGNYVSGSSALHYLVAVSLHNTYNILGRDI